ncbi:MAG: hypothetical protein LBT19_00895 [Candidatus Nomurabacteria bacterium]|jgi:hypothetical protein|nr:hypothetical protein [Candidatus Nomurabacteria bacterium]
MAKDVLRDNHTTINEQTLIEWLKKIEIFYLLVSHTINEIRRYDIVDPLYVKQFEVYYREAKGLLDTLFSERHVPTDNAVTYKVSLLDDINEYLANGDCWKQTQLKINRTLAWVAREVSVFDVSPRPEVEQRIIETYSNPINAILAEYHQRNKKKYSGKDEVAYTLTYDENDYGFRLNGVLIFRTKLGNTETFWQGTFRQAGKTKRYIGDGGVNTAVIRNNFDLPPSLKKLMMRTTHKKQGIIVRTQIMRSEIINNYIDEAEIRAWLEAKRTK